LLDSLLQEMQLFLLPLLVCVASLFGKNGLAIADSDFSVDWMTSENFVGISRQDEELLVGNMNNDIENLDRIIQKKDELEHHLVEHFDMVEFNVDDIQLKQAESALQKVDIRKLKFYKESLQKLKMKLSKSKGKAQFDILREIGYIRENANMLIEAFEDNIKIAESKDQEFEEYEEISSEAEELLIEYIDQDIEKLENVIKQKSNLEHHIVEHFELEDQEVSPDGLKLKIAESALHTIDGEKLHSYENSLKDLKAKLMRSNGGKAKSFLVSQIENTRKNAKTIFEAFQENIRLAETFDHEFEEHNEIPAKLSIEESGNPNVLLSSDISYLDEIIENRNPGQVDNVQFSSSRISEGNIESERGIIGRLISSPFVAILLAVTLILIGVVIAVIANRVFYKSRNLAEYPQDLTCVSTCKKEKTPDSRTGLINQQATSPGLELVKEDGGWTSNNWQSWAASSNRRRHKSGPKC